jgi:hypothetical protein
VEQSTHLMKALLQDVSFLFLFLFWKTHAFFFIHFLISFIYLAWTITWSFGNGTSSTWLF